MLRTTMIGIVLCLTGQKHITYGFTLYSRGTVKLSYLYTVKIGRAHV